MELAMTTKQTLTMHTLGLPQEQKGLTSHMKRKLRKPAANVPKIGELIDIDIAGVVFEDDEGNPKTPMAKVRYDHVRRQWQQVSVALAGLMVFYNTAPAMHHTKARVISVIPNGRAVYVEPE